LGKSKAAKIKDLPDKSLGLKISEDVHRIGLNFKQEIDLRGLRGDEALQQVMYYIDEAVVVGVSSVRLLHGTGTGALRTLIRNYLGTVPEVKSFRDEHVQLGGAGITVVEFKH
jgi:DNA mismatch repair protein MutS2